MFDIDLTKHNVAQERHAEKGERMKRRFEQKCRIQMGVWQYENASFYWKLLIVT